MERARRAEVSANGIEAGGIVFSEVAALARQRRNDGIRRLTLVAAHDGMVEAIAVAISAREPARGHMYIAVHLPLLVHVRLGPDGRMAEIAAVRGRIAHNVEKHQLVGIELSRAVVHFGRNRP